MYPKNLYYIIAYINVRTCTTTTITSDSDSSARTNKDYITCIGKTMAM